MLEYSATMNLTHLIIGAVIGAILVMMWMTCETFAQSRDYLAGCWVGEPAFLEQAGLSDMRLVISPAKCGVREGYILLVGEDGDVIQAETLEVAEEDCMRRWLGTMGVLARVQKANDWVLRLGDERYGASLCVQRGTLMLWKGGVLYGLLTKDFAASDAANAVFEDFGFAGGKHSAGAHPTGKHSAGKHPAGGN